MASTNNTSGSGRPPSPTLATILEIDQSRQALPVELRDKYVQRSLCKVAGRYGTMPAGGEFLGTQPKCQIAQWRKSQDRQVINAFPSALSLLDDAGRLLIHVAACFNRPVSFVPLLAEEGVKLNVGGEGKRGGLLVEDPNSPHGFNVLQYLASVIDYLYLDVIKSFVNPRS